MSDQLTVTVDASLFSLALRKYAKALKKDHSEALKEAARNFTRRIIAITPPSQGKSGSGARKLGEGAVESDIGRIIRGAPKDFVQFFEKVNGGPYAPAAPQNKGAAALGLIYSQSLRRPDLAPFHEDKRNKSNGRVFRRSNPGQGIHNPGGRRSGIGLTDRASLQWFKKDTAKKVGKLASGWNAAAEGLGYKAPAWIRRHGSSRGDVLLQLEGDDMHVTISNQVKFAGSVKGLQRRVQSALDMQARAMERRVSYVQRKAQASAGL